MAAIALPGAAQQAQPLGDIEEIAACAVPGFSEVAAAIASASQRPGSQAALDAAADVALRSRAQLEATLRKEVATPAFSSSPLGQVPFVAAGPKSPAGWFNETVAIISGDKELCTGTLVGPDALLTAGHCVCNYALDNPQRPFKPYIVLGQNVADGFGSVLKERMYLDLQRTTLYEPGFCQGLRSAGETHLYGNDLALLFLEAAGAKQITPDLSPPAPDEIVILDRQRLWLGAGRGFIGRRGNPQVFPATPATPQLYLSHSVKALIVVGFGLGRDPGKKSQAFRVGEKRHACVDIRSRICGFAADRARYRCAAGLEMVLADPAEERDTCPGDSGGPVFAMVRSGAIFQYYLVGVTSRGTTAGECGRGGVYSLVTPRVVDWMRSKGVSIPTYEFPDQ